MEEENKEKGKMRRFSHRPAIAAFRQRTPSSFPAGAKSDSHVGTLVKQSHGIVAQHRKPARRPSERRYSSMLEHGNRRTKQPGLLAAGFRLLVECCGVPKLNKESDGKIAQQHTVNCKSRKVARQKRVRATWHRAVALFCYYRRPITDNAQLVIVWVSKTWVLKMDSTAKNRVLAEYILLTQTYYNTTPVY